jgi:hypothetical protein
MQRSGLGILSSVGTSSVDELVIVHIVEEDYFLYIYVSTFFSLEKVIKLCLCNFNKDLRKNE